MSTRKSDPKHWRWLAICPNMKIISSLTTRSLKYFKFLRKVYKSTIWRKRFWKVWSMQLGTYPSTLIGTDSLTKIPSWHQTIDSIFEGSFKFRGWYVHEQCILNIFKLIEAQQCLFEYTGRAASDWEDFRDRDADQHKRIKVRLWFEPDEEDPELSVDLQQSAKITF